MQLKNLLLATSVFTFTGLVGAQAQSLSGTVSSTEEGQMEGVLVSAKKEGSTVTTTVVTNDKGEFSFPAGRLEPGKYTITTRAVGFALVGPKTVDVGAASATAEVKLAKARNVVPQLSNGEWLMSVPGSDQFKASFLLDCQGCHTLQRVFTAVHSADEWKQVFTRMGRYAPESTPIYPQLIVQGGARSERPRVAANMMQQASEYLEKVSLSNPDREEYNFKTLPRPKHAWYSDFGNQVVGELDPKTGKVSDYKLELLRPDQPKGSLDIEFDPDGNLWIGMSYQGGASKIDRKTKQVTTYALNKEWLDLTTQTNMVTPTHMYVDNKVWMTDTATRNLYRLDITTGKWENLGISKLAERQISGYGLPTDKNNNVYMLEFGGNSIGMRNGKTGEVKIWSHSTAATRSACSIRPPSR